MNTITNQVNGISEMARLYPGSTLPADPSKGSTKTVTLDGITAVMLFNGKEWMKVVTLDVAQVSIAPLPVAPSLDNPPVCSLRPGDNGFQECEACQ